MWEGPCWPRAILSFCRGHWPVTMASLSPSASPINTCHPDGKDVCQEAGVCISVRARGTSQESEEKVVDDIPVGSDAEIMKELLFLTVSRTHLP